MRKIDMRWVSFMLLLSLGLSSCKEESEEIMKLKAERLSLQNEAARQKVVADSLNKMIFTLSGGAADRIKSLIEENSQLTGRLQLRESSLDTLRSRLSTTQGQLKGAEESIGRLTLETNRKDSIISRLERSLGQRESEAATLRTQNEALQTTSRELNERVSRISTQVGELRQRTDAIATDASTSRSAISTLRDEITRQFNALTERLQRRQQGGGGTPQEAETKN